VTCSCKRCRYIEGRWAMTVTGGLWELLSFLCHCPSCGEKLNPGGTTEPMVERRVAEEALGAFGREEETCFSCDVSCQDGGLPNHRPDFDECCKRRLAWAEQQAKETNDD
jgi:hypothetical protein